MNTDKKEYEEVFEGKTILITGGLGFIGSNLAHKLVELNPKKITFDLNIFLQSIPLNGDWP